MLVTRILLAADDVACMCMFVSEGMPGFFCVTESQSQNNGVNGIRVLL